MQTPDWRAPKHGVQRRQQGENPGDSPSDRSRNAPFSFPQAAVLSALDAKIELNQRLNAELEGLAKLLYDYWFVQYDFPLSPAQAAALRKPHLTGHPYRSSGGPMVFHPQLKREIPMGWSSVSFDDFAENLDSKRIPLSKEERNKRQGHYPYYGATSVMDHVDDYIFDGRFILLAEDGSIMDKDGFPVMQYVEGKCWVNNHAHVIRPRNMDHLEFLFHTLKRLPVVNIVTGSIQKKITQDNLNKVALLKPDSEVLRNFANLADPIREQLLNNDQQSHHLAQLRDWLLPMLMNGQVGVSAKYQGSQFW